ncbi:hypothetical protein HPB49_010535 [Dermacentor silvarum]|uniref:Uncharacterized protein n=1 Tax=Dermacentor silvarum TaxID=543639 RepID=A0ACB8D4L9_DERSI|nr:hypothetical protein HPB49_010535 [Dermacentor silvarum]
MVYCNHKVAIAKEALYDNFRGSGFPCEARGGVLRTCVLRATFTADLGTACPRCQALEETIKHVVLECPGLHPTVACTQGPATDNCSDTIVMALCFHGTGEPPRWDAGNLRRGGWNTCGVIKHCSSRGL